MTGIKKIDPMANSTPLKTKKGFWLLATLLVLLLVLLGMLVWVQPTAPSVFQYVLGKEEILKLDNGRVNVLLLGIGGPSHEGPNLTDTIIVASYNSKDQSVNLLSIPRDLWVDSYAVKINTLYQKGLDKEDGLGLVREEVGNILGIKVPYAIRVDFNGFIKAVDLVEGIDVEVEKSFDDYLYPVKSKENEMCGYKEEVVDLSEEQAKTLQTTTGKHKALVAPDGQIATVSASETADITYNDNLVAQYFPCRFEHLQFKKGLVHMDGLTSLKYVRSRHGTNQEGTDFARSRRQQQAINAFKSKVLSLDTVTDPQKIVGLVQAFGSSIETNITAKEYLEFASIIKETNKVNSWILADNGVDKLLISPDPGKYGGAWVLVPAKSDYSQIHQFVQNVFNGIKTASGSARN